MFRVYARLVCRDLRKFDIDIIKSVVTTDVFGKFYLDTFQNRRFRLKRFESGLTK